MRSTIRIGWVSVAAAGVHDCGAVVGGQCLDSARILGAPPDGHVTEEAAGWVIRIVGSEGEVGVSVDIFHERGFGNPVFSIVLDDA
jgi:hypothetical protein